MEEESKSPDDRDFLKSALADLKENPQSYNEKQFEFLQSLSKQFDQLKTKNFQAFEENKQNSSRTIDNWILTASLGSFGILLAFIKEIVITPFLAALVIVDFIVFILASFTVLQSHQLIRDSSHKEQLKMKSDKWYLGGEDKEFNQVHQKNDKLNKKAMDYFKFGVGLALITAIVIIIVMTAMHVNPFQPFY